MTLPADDSREQSAIIPAWVDRAATAGVAVGTGDETCRAIRRQNPWYCRKFPGRDTTPRSRKFRRGWSTTCPGTLRPSHR